MDAPIQLGNGGGADAARKLLGGSVLWAGLSLVTSIAVRVSWWCAFVTAEAGLLLMSWTNHRASVRKACRKS